MAVPFRRAAIQVRNILGMSKHSRGGLQHEPVLHSHGPPACSEAASPWPGYLFDQITTHMRILTFCCQDLQQHAAWARRSDSSNAAAPAHLVSIAACSAVSPVCRLLDSNDCNAHPWSTVWPKDHRQISRIHVPEQTRPQTSRETCKLFRQCPQLDKSSGHTGDKNGSAGKEDCCSACWVLLCLCWLASTY